MKWRVRIIKAAYLNGGRQHWRVYKPDGSFYCEAQSIEYAVWKIGSYLNRTLVARQTLAAR